MIQIAVQSDGVGIALAPISFEHSEIVMAAPEGAWWIHQGLGFKLSPVNIEYLRDHFPTASWIGDLSRLDEVDALQMLTTHEHREPDEADRTYGFKSAPYPPQLRAFAFGRYLPHFALFCDPGTGKSKMVLDIMAAKFEAHEIDCLLIIAPNGINGQFVREQIPLHLPEVDHLAVAYARGTSKARQAVLDEIMTPNADVLRILAINIEALSSSNDRVQQDLMRFVRSGRCAIVVDEATRIKNLVKRTKAVLALAEHATVRAILTGTPIVKGVTDLFYPFKFLNIDILGFKAFDRFRSRYCILAPAYYGAPPSAVKVVAHQNLPELISRIGPWSFRMTKEGLPEKVYERRHVALTAAQEGHYDALLEEFETAVGGGTLTVANAGARLVRLQQVLSGFLPETETSPAIRIPSNRTRSLVDLIEDIGDQQLVVWVRFQMDADIIAEAFDLSGIRYTVCDGREDTAERTLRKQAFARGEHQVMVANWSAMGTGVDGLQVTGLAVLYSHTFDAEKRWQGEDRTHRYGLKADQATYIEFMVPDTVDELLLDNIDAKASLAQMVVNDPKLLRRPKG